MRQSGFHPASNPVCNIKRQEQSKQDPVFSKNIAQYSNSCANKANDANKKLQRTLLGFDQINKLDDTSGSSSSDSAGTGGLTGKDMFETLNVSNEMKTLVSTDQGSLEKC